MFKQAPIVNGPSSYDSQSESIEEFLVQCANRAIANVQSNPKDVGVDLFGSAKTPPEELRKIQEIIQGGGKQADLYLIAGAIGSGKSTFARMLMQDQYFRNLEFVSADIYAENLFNQSEDIKKNHRMAKEYMSYKLFSFLSSQTAFVWEMVPSKLEKLFPLRAAIHRNFKLTLFYISTDDVQVNVDRVNQRNVAGAWPVSEEKVQSRYQMCLKNYPVLTKLCDTVIVVPTDRYPRIASLKSPKQDVN